MAFLLYSVYHAIFTTVSRQRLLIEHFRTVGDHQWSLHSFKPHPKLNRPLQWPQPISASAPLPLLTQSVSNSTGHAYTACSGGCRKGKANTFCCNGGLCQTCCIDRGGCALQNHKPDKLSKQEKRKCGIVSPSASHLSTSALSSSAPAPSAVFSFTAVPPSASSASGSGFSSASASASSTQLRSSTTLVYVPPFSPPPTCDLYLPDTMSPIRCIDCLLQEMEEEEEVQATEFSRVSDDIQRELNEVDAYFAESEECFSSPFMDSSLLEPSVTSTSESSTLSGPSAAVSSSSDSHVRPAKHYKTVQMNDLWMGQTGNVNIPQKRGQALKVVNHNFWLVFYTQDSEMPLVQYIQVSRGWPNWSLLTDGLLLPSLISDYNPDRPPHIENFDIKCHWWSVISLEHVFHVSLDCTLVMRVVPVKDCKNLDNIIRTVDAAIPSVLHMRTNMRGERSGVHNLLADCKGKGKAKTIDVIDISDSDSDSDSQLPKKRKRPNSLTPSHSYSTPSLTSTSSLSSSSSTPSTRVSTPSALGDDLIPTGVIIWDPYHPDRDLSLPPVLAMCPWPQGMYVCDVVSGIQQMESPELRAQFKEIGDRFVAVFGRDWKSSTYYHNLSRW
ncbi:hypothetical protein VKT23_013769 [Stygiomarasmius scandens]|uniref:Uncharacterized protein n=1 Tax=Marasmiellus scandens TaxID=2682957 RepID=A0ABR1J797_9AGAR